MRRGWCQQGILAAALALAALEVVAEPVVAGDPIVPRKGTYAGAGIRVDAPDDGMQVGFIFDGATVNVRILGFAFPGCNGFTSVNPGPVTDARFDLSAGSMSESQRLKGRWVSRNLVKGKLILERPDAASCGDQGTWVYKYSARRYGGT